MSGMPNQPNYDDKPTISEEQKLAFRESLDKNPMREWYDNLQQDAHDSPWMTVSFTIFGILVFIYTISYLLTSH